MTEPVELVTAAPWHWSVGDIATAEVTTAELARRGVPVVPVSVPSGRLPAVIGGGAILHQGEGPWGQLLGNLCPDGPHLLNAVGVQTGGDWSHLNGYRYLSVRDEVSRERLRAGGVTAEIHLAPCPAMQVEPTPLERLRHIPRWGRITEWIHRASASPIVIEATPELSGLAVELRREAISVQPRPWCQQPLTWDIPAAPLTHSPANIAAIVRESRGVISRSLHLCVFAIAAGVPFVVPEIGPEDHQAAKIRAYLERCFLGHLVTDRERATDLLGDADTALSVRVARSQERVRCRNHLDRMAAILTADRTPDAA